MGSVVWCRARALAPSGFGGVGAVAGVGAQRLRLCCAGRWEWLLMISVAWGRAQVVALNGFGSGGPGAGGGAQSFRRW